MWVGRNPHKGLAVLAFNGYAARLAAPYHPRLRYVAAVHVSGPTTCNLLAVWAQNASAGVNRKRQIGPLRRALVRYREFLGERPTIVAGDLNSNAIWDKPGWRNNHTTTVEVLAGLGLVSAYHAMRGEAHGAESVPTLYWRDRTKDGPTYHIDYVFLPDRWIGKVTNSASVPSRNGAAPASATTCRSWWTSMSKSGERVMVKVALAAVSIMLGVAACSGSAPPPLPPVWSANYAVPFDAMVVAWPRSLAGAFAVSAPDLP